MVTVSNGEPTRKDTNMKLLYFFTAFLALSLAEEEKQAVKEIENVDHSAVESTNIELLKEVADLKPAPSSLARQGQRKRRWQSQRYNQPTNTWVQPAVQNDYYTSAPAPSTTTSVPVLKNDVYYGDNGAYKYEYQIADGTWVAEEGYYTDPKQTEESLVKKGWYSFLGADGVTYTVKYWADRTGYHAYGTHLPSAAQATVSPSQTYTTTQRSTYNPPQQTYKPPQQTNNPPQQPYNPPQQTYKPPQQTYKPPQQTYNPSQQTYNPPQQTYNPSQQTYNDEQPQQTYYPTQSTNQQNYYPNYNQQQQQTYYPNYNV